MITLKSFGFKYGKPEANIILDVSYFINPWRDASIKNEVDSVEKRKKILEFMLKQEGVKPFVEKTSELLKTYHNLFPDENLQVAFCCSAGEYRSPSIVELVKNQLESENIICKVKQSETSKL